MFDLKSALRDWRKSAQQSWRGRPSLGAGQLDELEDHLREEFSTLVANHHSPADAWNLAIATLGNSTEISKEFAKLNRLATPDRIALGLILTIGTLAISGIIIIFSPRYVAELVESLGPLTVVVGWMLGLLATTIAAYVAMRSHYAHSPIAPLTQSALRLMRFTSVVAATLTTCGLGTFFVWLAIPGAPAWKYWFSNWPQFFGMALVCVCQIATAVTARKARISTRIPISIALANGGLILLTWFGPAAFYGRQSHTPYAIIAFGGCTVCLALAAIAFRSRSRMEHA